MSPIRILAPLPLALLCASCYLSHPPGASDADAPPDADAAVPDAPLDTAPVDPGPPREPRWVRLAPDEEGPPPRHSLFAFYDGDRDRVVVFGGYDYRLSSDPGGYPLGVWQLELETERWTRIATLERPLVNLFENNEAAFDPERGRVVLVGAEVGGWDGPARNIALDLETFRESELPPAPFPSSTFPEHSVHDRERQRIVVYGGYPMPHDGVWIFDLARDRWSTVEVTNAPPWRGRTPLVAAGEDRFVLYGGYNYEGDDQAELWELDLAAATFRQLPLAEPPVGRWDHMAVWDAARRRVFVHGGGRGIFSAGDTFIDPAAPSVADVDPDLVSPSGREFAMVLDTRRRRAITFGGRDAWPGAAWAFILP